MANSALCSDSVTDWGQWQRYANAGQLFYSTNTDCLSLPHLYVTNLCSTTGHHWGL